MDLNLQVQQRSQLVLLDQRAFATPSAMHARMFRTLARLSLGGAD